MECALDVARCEKFPGDLLTGGFVMHVHLDGERPGSGRPDL
jgi:hypothetical protein